MQAGKYSIELAALGGAGAGVEGTIASDDDLATARRLYRAGAADNPDRVVLLCDRARILARSDRRDHMPSCLDFKRAIELTTFGIRSVSVA